MNESEYQYLQNKKWRAITYDWDTLAAYGNTSRLYCLTDFQAAWLLSNTEYMRWGSRWVDCPCTQSDLDAMKAELDYNLMSCFDFQPYQLQTVYDSSQNALLAGYQSDWDGSNPSSVNPNAPDDFFDGDGSPDRIDALCTALTLWAYSYAVDWISRASTILGITSFVSALVDFMIPVGGNIAVRVISGLTAPLEAQVHAFENTAALDTVICDWKAVIEGQAINATNWTNGVQGLSYTVDSDAWYIQQIFAADTQLLQNFLTFVNALGDGYQLAQIGASICACGEPVPELLIAMSSVNSNPAGTESGGLYSSQDTDEGVLQHRIRVVVVEQGTTNVTTGTIKWKYTTSVGSTLQRVNTQAGAAPYYNVTGAGTGTLLRNETITPTVGVTYQNSGAQVLELARNSPFSDVEIWVE